MSIILNAYDYKDYRILYLLDYKRYRVTIWWRVYDHVKTMHGKNGPELVKRAKAWIDQQEQTTNA